MIHLQSYFSPNGPHVTFDLNVALIGSLSAALPVSLNVKYSNYGVRVIQCNQMNISSIKAKISSLWSDLEREDFSVTCDGIDLEDVLDLRSILVNNATIIVKSNCIAFTAYDTYDKVREHANIFETSPAVDDNLFTPLEDIPRVDEFTDIVFDELQRRMIAYDWNSTKKSEFTMREFIGPLLVAAIILMDCSGIKMYSERKVVGKFGNGPLDYDIAYKEFHICVAEAKREDLDKGIAQNIAQLVACRNEYELNERKRSASEAFDEHEINLIPSSGVVSSAMDWIFTRYIYDDALKKWHFFRSTTMHLNLSPANEAVEVASMRFTIKRLLKVVCGILRYQKEKVDMFSNKRRK